MATITITPGNSFNPTETVTSTKLNDLGSPTAALTAASIGTADIADDAVTSDLIADDAVTPALIADNAVTTPAILDANITFAKLTDVIDDDTMATATDTTLATSESIKAYVDAQVVFSQSFESPEANIPSDTSGITYSHGLSSTPKIIQVFLRCKIADSGYSVGDEVLLGDYGDAGQTQNSWASSTEVGWGHTYAGATVIISDKNANAFSVVSSPNFLVFIRAYA